MGYLQTKEEIFYRNNKWSSDAGLRPQRARTGFFGHLCPEVTRVCAVTPPCAGGGWSLLGS